MKRILIFTLLPLLVFAADSTIIIPTNLNVQGNLSVQGNKPEVPRSLLIQDNFSIYGLPFESFRESTAYATALPATSSSTFLGLYTGTFGTGTPYIATSDLKAAGATSRTARIMVCLPPEYVAGESVRLRFSAGMLTTVADTSATLTVAVYKSDRKTLKTGSELYGGAAQTINSLTLADKNFDLAAATLSPGDWIDINVTVAVSDAATATAVIAAIGAAELLLDIKG